MALHQMPMVWGMNQVTAHPPMSEAIAQLHRIEAQPGVVCGSIATCYFLADVPDMGASVYIVTNNDLTAARKLCRRIGRGASDAALIGLLYATYARSHRPSPERRPLPSALCRYA